jgi:uncharacterized LabA/DUF88 family protein
MFSEYPYYFQVKTNINKIINVYVKETGFNFITIAFIDKNNVLQKARYEKNSIDIKIMISAFLQEYDIIVDNVFNATKNHNKND